MPDASVPVVAPGSSPAQPKGAPSTALTMGGGSGAGGAVAGGAMARSKGEASMCGGSGLDAMKPDAAHISVGGGSGIGSPAAAYLPSASIKREKEVKEEEGEDEVWALC